MNRRHLKWTKIGEAWIDDPDANRWRYRIKPNPSPTRGRKYMCFFRENADADAKAFHETSSIAEAKDVCERHCVQKLKALIRANTGDSEEPKGHPPN